jgi:hypothetical protein
MLMNSVILTISRHDTFKPLGIYIVFMTLRAALHLEAGPIHCVRGLKSSLMIGQKVQKSVPTPLHLEVGPIWWYDFSNQRMYLMTRPELVESGAPKMEGQCHISLKKNS